MGRAFEYRRKSKEARWDKMSKVFPKIARAITMAAKEGGSDPESNAKLRSAIQNAKAENMPKENVDKAIARASGADGATYQEISYEGKGPHGVLFFVECATDNTNRSVANLKMIFNKNGGEMVQTGQLNFMFSRKAVVDFEEPAGKDMDEVELELIDAGLEELTVNDGVAYAYGDYTSFASLTKAVEDLGIEARKSSLQRIPSSPVELTEEQLLEVETLIDKLEDDEDVQAVYTNIA